MNLRNWTWLDNVWLTLYIMRHAPGRPARCEYVHCARCGGQP